MKKWNWKLEARRNSAVIAVITLLLVVAVYLNWSYSREIDGDTLLEPLAGTVVDEETGGTGMDAEVEGETDGESVLTDAQVDGVSDADRFAEKQWNITVSGDGDTTTDTVGEEQNDKITSLSEYFAEARLSRQQSKDEALSILQTTLADENSSADAKADAEESIASMASNAICESRIENLVMAKGFSDCVAIVDGGAVSVVVHSSEEGLEATEVAKIKDIILSEVDVSADKIRVIEAD